MEVRALTTLADHPDTLLVEAATVLDDLTPRAVSLLRRVAGYESCPKAVCCAKAKTLAKRMGCSDRTIRRRFAELAEFGLIEKVRRRMRSSWRMLTDLGRAVLAVLKAGGAQAVADHLARGDGGGVSAQVSAHKGESETSLNKPRNPASRGATDPAEYRVPRGSVLGVRAWEAVAAWLRTARSVSWSRCKMAHGAFCRLVGALQRCSEWRGYAAAMFRRGIRVSPESLVALAVGDAMKRGRDFGVVETATKYIGAVLLACVREQRLPGERKEATCRA